MINNTHLKKHGITKKQYMLKYPNAKLICNSSLNHLRKLNKNNIEFNRKRLTKLWDENYEEMKETYGQNFKTMWKNNYEETYRRSVSNLLKSAKSRTVKRYALPCDHCGKLFDITKQDISRNLKRGQKHFYCSKKCSNISSHKIDVAIKNLPKTNENTKCHLISKGGYRTDIGHFVRSTWEANICRIFHQYKINYEYEPKEFKLSDGTIYIPDLYIPSKNLWIEIKGYAHSVWIKKFKLFTKEYPHINIVVINGQNYKNIINNINIKNKE